MSRIVYAIAINWWTCHEEAQNFQNLQQEAEAAVQLPSTPPTDNFRERGRNGTPSSPAEEEEGGTEQVSMGERGACLTSALKLKEGRGRR